MRKCEYCGKEFKAFSPDYCSRECYERNVLEKWGCADKIAESGGNIMSEPKAESKIMDTLIEETEEIMEYKPYDKVDRPMHYTAETIEMFGRVEV